MAPFFAFGQSNIDVDELEEQIEQNSQVVNELEEKIQEDQKKLDQLQGEKNTLNKAILNLTYSENKIQKDILTTGSEINNTEKEITTLETEIQTLEREMNERRYLISETIKDLRQKDSKSFWEVMLSYETFSGFLDEIFSLQTLSDLLRSQTQLLAQNRSELGQKKEITFGKKVELEEQKEQLADQKQVVAITKQQKNELLSETQSTEAVYQASLAEKLEQKREFESLLLELESQLQIAISKDSYAGNNPGLFSWPVEGYRVTQFFGNTDFAKTAYNGRGHSGIDFATPIGTPVRAVMDGTIIGVGNTENYGAYDSAGRYRKCISYGGWFVVKHDNGLATLGAHLSMTKVQVGQRVKRGEIIAYTGNTGYSTGPHLHFSTYAAEGVTFRELNSTYCNGALIPIIALNAYLDPFAYLPRPYFGLSPVSYGESSNAVKNLQNMLKHERMFPLDISSNGQYGPTTAKAVLEWQKQYRRSEDQNNFRVRDVEFYENLF